MNINNDSKYKIKLSDNKILVRIDRISFNSIKSISNIACTNNVLKLKTNDVTIEYLSKIYLFAMKSVYPNIQFFFVECVNTMRSIDMKTKYIENYFRLFKYNFCDIYNLLDKLNCDTYKEILKKMYLTDINNSIFKIHKISDKYSDNIKNELYGLYKRKHTDYISEQPKNILLMISEYLSIKDRCSITMCSKKMKGIFELTKLETVINLEKALKKKLDNICSRYITESIHTGFGNYRDVVDAGFHEEIRQFINKYY